MYAIVNINGTQTKVSPDSVVEVPRLKGDPGQKLTFDQVMLVSALQSAHDVGHPEEWPDRLAAIAAEFNLVVE